VENPLSHRTEWGGGRATDVILTLARQRRSGPTLGEVQIAWAIGMTTHSSTRRPILDLEEAPREGAASKVEGVAESLWEPGRMVGGMG